MLVENALNIYTDGSSFSGPRRGGVGMRFVLVDASGNEQTQDWSPPGYAAATNNQMELQAAIMALKEANRLDLCREVGKIVIHTDSMYICNNYRKAMFEWPKTGWLRRSGAPVLNAELWKELIRAMKATGCRVDCQWVKGHSKDEHNKAVDKLAKRSAKGPVGRPLTPVSVRRKRTSQTVAIGSVEMLGHRISIRVITCEYLRTQQLWKLKYEVVSKASPFFGMVDLIFSETLLKDGHRYHILVNDDTQNPRVVKVYRELPK